jgi:hypothetical protein
MVRAKSSGRSRRGIRSEEAEAAGARPAGAEESEESDGEYGVIREPDAQGGKRAAGQTAGPTWVPTRGREPHAAGSNKSARRSRAGAGDSADLLQRIRKPVELPGPFFKWSALIYPLLHPNWIRWLGLSFMTVLATGAISVTLFVSWIVLRFGAFLSIFAIASMALVCLALVSHVVSSFVEVIEETAAGEDRLERTMDFSWWDMLPRFMQALGAAAIAAALTFGVTYPLRRWFPWDAPELMLIQSILMYQLFPILLITNLVDGSWFPFKSLPATLRRLAACVGYLVAFWAITVPVAVAIDAALTLSFQYHLVAGIFAAGPLIAAWLLYYGHWLGRLARQLSDVE